MTTAVKEKVHGLNPLPFQIERAHAELSNLTAELAQADSRRRELIVQGVSRPAEELELKELEKEIESLRLRVDHTNIKIESLQEDLPRIDIAVRTQVDLLEAAKKRMLEVLGELKQLDAEAVALRDDKVVKRLVTIVKKRTDLVDELQSTLPNQIMGAEGYLHLAPTREFPRAPRRPEKIQNLVDILK